MELYNQLNGTAYDDPDEVQIYILENGISLSVRNDASFIIDSVLSLMEHQSTYNPNMPLRHLIYVTEMFRRLTRDRDLFGRKRILLPEPRFVVFYTGAEERPAVETMRLSDSYESSKCQNTGKFQLELSCTVYNLNQTEIKKQFSHTESIHAFITFVDRVRENRSRGDNRYAVEEAIDYCVGLGMLTDFFQRHREEIIRVTTIDMTYERRLEIAKREAEEEKAQTAQAAKKEGKIEAICDILSEYGDVSDDLKARIMKVEDTEKLRKLLKYAARANSVNDFVLKADADGII